MLGKGQKRAARSTKAHRIAAERHIKSPPQRAAGSKDAGAEEKGEAGRKANKSPPQIAAGKKDKKYNGKEKRKKVRRRKLRRRAVIG